MFVTDKDELEHSRLVDNYLAGGKGMSVYAGYGHKKGLKKFFRNLGRIAKKEAKGVAGDMAKDALVHGLSRESVTNSLKQSATNISKNVAKESVRPYF